MVAKVSIAAVVVMTTDARTRCHARLRDFDQGVTRWMSASDTVYRAVRR